MTSAAVASTATDVISKYSDLEVHCDQCDKPRIRKKRSASEDDAPPDIHRADQVEFEILRSLKKQHVGIERATRATVDQVLDPRTMLIIEKLKKRGLVSRMNGAVSTGKEANVYHCESAPIQTDESGTSGSKCLPAEIVIKVFRTSILGFKDRARYVEGEFRFRTGYKGTGNPRKMVRQWAEKEYRNLKRLKAHHIRTPLPLELRGHVIAMTFLGHDGIASPRLKDVTLPQNTWRRLYVEVVVQMINMFQDCRLVHGDLSEFNILYHSGHTYIIDVSQAVEHDHQHALDFLRRDCVNISKFFCRMIDTSEPDSAPAPPPLPDTSDNSAILEGWSWSPLPPHILFDLILNSANDEIRGSSNDIVRPNGLNRSDSSKSGPWPNFDSFGLADTDGFLLQFVDDIQRAKTHIRKKTQIRKNKAQQTTATNDRTTSSPGYEDLTGPRVDQLCMAPETDSAETPGRGDTPATTTSIDTTTTTCIDTPATTCIGTTTNTTTGIGTTTNTTTGIDTTTNTTCIDTTTATTCIDTAATRLAESSEPCAVAVIRSAEADGDRDAMAGQARDATTDGLERSVFTRLNCNMVTNVDQRMQKCVRFDELCTLVLDTILSREADNSPLETDLSSAPCPNDDHAYGGLAPQSEIDAQAFLESWIPSNLHQISDLRDIENSLEARTTGEKSVLDRLLKPSVGVGRLHRPSVSTIGGDPEGASSASDSATESEEEDGDPGKSTASFVNGKFTGIIPDGVSRQEWKKRVKELKAIARQNKIPKHVKKQKKQKHLHTKKHK